MVPVQSARMDNGHIRNRRSASSQTNGFRLIDLERDLHILHEFLEKLAQLAIEEPHFLPNDLKRDLCQSRCVIQRYTDPDLSTYSCNEASVRSIRDLVPCPSQDEIATGLLCLPKRRRSLSKLRGSSQRPLSLISPNSLNNKVVSESKKVTSTLPRSSKILRSIRRAQRSVSFKIFKKSRAHVDVYEPSTENSLSYCENGDAEGSGLEHIYSSDEDYRDYPDPENPYYNMDKSLVNSKVHQLQAHSSPARLGKSPRNSLCSPDPSFDEPRLFRVHQRMTARRRSHSLDSFTFNLTQDDTSSIDEFLLQIPTASTTAEQLRSDDSLSFKTATLERVFSNKTSPYVSAHEHINLVLSTCDSTFFSDADSSLMDSTTAHMEQKFDSNANLCLTKD